MGNSSVFLPCRWCARQAVRRGPVACADQPSSRTRCVLLPSGRARPASFFRWRSFSVSPLSFPRPWSFAPHPGGYKTKITNNVFTSIHISSRRGQSYLIAEDFYLAVSPMRGWSVAVRVGWRLLVSVDLDVQRQSLHALLAREVCAQTLHGYVYL